MYRSCCNPELKPYASVNIQTQQFCQRERKALQNVRGKCSWMLGSNLFIGYTIFQDNHDLISIKFILKNKFFFDNSVINLYARYSPLSPKNTWYHYQSRSNQTAQIVLHVVSCRVKNIVRTAPQVADLKTSTFRPIYLDCGSLNLLFVLHDMSEPSLT